MENGFLDLEDPRDGYTRDGFIAAVPGLHKALKFTFRPALPEERIDFRQAITDAPKSAALLSRQLLANHVKTWTATKKGEPAQISSDMMRLLPPAIFQKMLDQVLGYEPAEAEADAKN